MSDDEPTSPNHQCPVSRCEYHGELLAAVEQINARYLEALELIRKPPWLQAVLDAANVASAIRDQGIELAALKARVDGMAGVCEERHQDDPMPSIVPGAGG